MSSYVFHMNAVRTLRKGCSLFGTLPVQNFMFYHSGFNKLICKETVKSGYKRYSTSGNSKSFSNLMDKPIINPFKIFYMANFVIRRYFDEKFDLEEFVDGSKTAVEVLTRHLYAGNLKELKDLVTPDVLEKLKDETKNFSLKEKLDVIDRRDILSSYTYDISIINTNEEEITQKWEISAEPKGRGLVTPDVLGEFKVGAKNFSLKEKLDVIDGREIFSSYTHDISVMNTNEEENTQKEEISAEPKGRFVKISMIYHVLEGTHEDFGTPDFNKKLFFLTYQFIKDFNQDKSSTWIISGLNHFNALEQIWLTSSKN